MCNVNYHVQNTVSGNMIIYMFTLYLWYNMMKQLHWQLVLDIDELCCQVWHKFTYLSAFFMHWSVNWLEYDLSIQEYLFFIYKQVSVLVNLLNSSTCLARIKLIVCRLCSIIMLNAILIERSTTSPANLLVGIVCCTDIIST